MQTEILTARVEFIEQPFLTPLIISSGAITVITEARATVTVRVDGKEATGRGSIYLSDLWAWPDPNLTHKQRDADLRRLCEDIAEHLYSYCGGKPAHPLELGLRLHENVCREKTPPTLARAMCASPFDAAVHDATGIALNKSAFDLYEDDVKFSSADSYFRNNDACAAIRAVISKPKRELKAWYLTIKNDFTEQLRPWVQDRGYRCFKIKILGKDNDYDVARTVEVYRIVKKLGAKKIELSVDTNEANPDAESVLDYLKRLQQADAEAYQAFQYFEQPTGRDITVHKFDWHEVAKLKPIMLDEGLTSLELMAEAKHQGWSGFALKTCKGHSFALTTAAWARQNGLLLSLQDLTNPGYSMIHAALFAAHVHTMNDVEMNSPQFTPAANEFFLPRFPGLFDPHDGVHALSNNHPIGLGSIL
jgi:L-alanine-DL-glutamate epimerase-like enolase superfamily enzyme